MSAHSLNDRYLRLIGIPLAVFALLMSQMPISFPGRYDLLWKYFVLSVLYTWLLWEGARWMLIRIREKNPGLEQTSRRILIMLALFTVEVAVVQALVTGLTVYLHLESPSWISAERTWLVNSAFSLFFVALVAGIYEAQYFFSQYRLALQKAEHLKTRQTQQKLDALKSRVNPHFLFNALTTLSALIGEDAARAEQFVDELSRVYRYLLRAGRQSEATLAEELQFVESYAFLLKNRFSEQAFSLKTPSPPHPGMLLPALTLQNAVDYLVRTQHTPLHIALLLQDQRLVVQCPNHPKVRPVEVVDLDWRQLSAQGVTRNQDDRLLYLNIPLHLPNQPV
ncbi:MAG: histidine kinase [Saprospiraceae bacterium]|nr:histidine kinase [Saprospiraceae bacterium]